MFSEDPSVATRARELDLPTVATIKRGASGLPLMAALIVQLQAAQVGVVHCHTGSAIACITSPHLTAPPLCACLCFGCQPLARFYGLAEPTALLHSDIVSSLHAIANAQADGALQPQALVVGRVRTPAEPLNSDAVAQALRGDPRLFNVALYNLATTAAFASPDVRGFFAVSRASWDWTAAPPVQWGAVNDVAWLIDSAMRSEFAVVDATGTVVTMLQSSPVPDHPAAADATVNGAALGGGVLRYTDPGLAPLVTVASAPVAGSEPAQPAIIVARRQTSAAAAATTAAATATAAPVPLQPQPAAAPAVATTPAPTAAAAPAPAAPATAASASGSEEHHHHHDGGANVDLTHKPAAPVETLVTMFTTPFGAKPGSQKWHIQVNAIRALAYMPEVEIVVFSKDSVVKYVCVSCVCVCVC